MPNYRRSQIAGGTYFFTVVTYRRRRLLTGELGRQCLRSAIEKVRLTYPFEMPASILLPEHLHAIWTLPRGDHDYSTRWRRIKEEFTRAWFAAGGTEASLTTSRRSRNERGIWQRRFWEHTIEDEDDLRRHIDYIHYNAVKHGEAKCPKDWPYSTFEKWVDAGAYEANWGCTNMGVLKFEDLRETAMEYELQDER